MFDFADLFFRSILFLDLTSHFYNLDCLIRLFAPAWFFHRLHSRNHFNSYFGLTVCPDLWKCILRGWTRGCRLSPFLFCQSEEPYWGWIKYCTKLYVWISCVVSAKPRLLKSPASSRLRTLLRKMVRCAISVVSGETLRICSAVVVSCMCSKFFAREGWWSTMRGGVHLEYPVVLILSDKFLRLGAMCWWMWCAYARWCISPVDPCLC